MKRLISLMMACAFIMVSMLAAVPAANAANNIFVDGINSARANQGKPQLVVNGDLQRTAQDKANRMARANSLTADGYSAAWKGGSQAVAADPAARASELLHNDFIGRQAGTTLKDSYGIVGVGEAVSSNGTLYVAINVAPAPYTPSTGGDAGSGNDTGNSNGNAGPVDNSAVIAATEARVRAEAEEAKSKADAQAKAVAEAEAKKQAEAKKIADAEAKKIADAEETRLATEAEKKRLEQETLDAKATEEAEARIAEAEEKARVEAEAKKNMEADILKRNEEEQEQFEFLIDGLRLSALLSALVAVAGAAVALRSTPVVPKTFTELTGMEELDVEVPLPPSSDDVDDDDNNDDDDDGWVKKVPSTQARPIAVSLPKLPATTALPKLPKREDS